MSVFPSLSRSLLIAIWMLSCISALAGTISVFSLPNIGTDAASGINTSNTYLCALVFGDHIEPLFVNNVPFQQINLNGKGSVADENHPSFTGSDINHGGTWSVSANIVAATSGRSGFADEGDTGRTNFVEDEDYVGVGSQSDGAMLSLLAHMNYVKAIPEDLTSGSKVQMNFGGLQSGKKYALRYYYRQWSKNRYINFSFNGEGSQEKYAGNPLDLDAGGAAFIEYNFIAATNYVAMQMEVLWPGNGPHIYGVTLQLLDGSAGEHGGTQKPVNASNTTLPSKYGVGWWIWALSTCDQQTCRFWQSFVVPNTSPVRSAILRVSADNFYHVFLDGQDLGRGSDWRSLTSYDLSLCLKESGTHVLAVEAMNDFGAAGIILGLNIQLKDGQLIKVGSDANWRIVPNNERGWETKLKADPSWSNAKIVGAAGVANWRIFDYEWGSRVFNVPPMRRVVVPFWQREWFQVLVASFLAISVAMGIYLGGRLMINSNERAVIWRERARIARDLHDDLSAGLTHLVVYGESSKRALRACQEIQPTLNEICLKTRHLLDSLSETIWIVNSQRDSLRDLAMHLCDYMEVFLSPTTIRCRFDISCVLPTLPCDVGIRRNLLLAFKEALCNAVKYSGASELQLRIHWEGHELVVRIEDNGKGFDPVAVNKERNGLFNMCQRAKDAGGNCQVTSKPGHGCQIVFRVPLRRSSRFHLWLSKKPEDQNDLLTFPPKGVADKAPVFSQFKPR